MKTVYSQDTPPAVDIPIEYVEFPELVPGETPESEAQLPLPEMEVVEIYQPPVPEPQVNPPQNFCDC